MVMVPSTWRTFLRASRMRRRLISARITATLPRVLSMVHSISPMP